MIDKKIKSAFHEALDGQHREGSFDTLWNEYQDSRNKQRSKSSLRIRKMGIILAATFILGISGIVSGQYITYNFKRDVTSYVFEMDEEVLGTWKVIDCIKEEKDFMLDKPNRLGKVYLEQLEFHKNGELSAVFNMEGKSGVPRSGLWVWTKNHIISEEKQVNNQYTMKKIKGEMYLFSEWKDDRYRWGIIPKPNIYVLKKVEDAKVTEKAPKPITIREDNVKVPFVDNEELKGTWKSISFVNEIEDFQGENDTMYPILCLQTLDIQENGIVEIQKLDIYNRLYTDTLRWSGDSIINEGNKTVSKCIIKKIEDETYMFYEWKTGDYTIGGEDPSYYVLIKQ